MLAASITSISPASFPKMFSGWSRDGYWADGNLLAGKYGRTVYKASEAPQVVRRPEIPTNSLACVLSPQKPSSEPNIKEYLKEGIPFVVVDGYQIPVIG